jgi:hypothetical protein
MFLDPTSLLPFAGDPTSLGYAGLSPLHRRHAELTSGFNAQLSSNFTSPVKPEPNDLTKTHGVARKRLFSECEGTEQPEGSPSKLPVSPVKRRKIAAASTSFNVPDTPIKPNRARQFPSRFRNVYKEVKETGGIKINDQQVKLFSLQLRGTFMEILRIESDNQLFSVPNDSLVFKMYTQRRSNSKESIVLGYMENSIKNYKKALKLGLNVATIYNIKSAKTDGFIVQEKIPYEVDVNNEDHINKVREFFIASLKNNVTFDLKPSNLGIREDGKVALFDFVEDPSDGLMIFINQAVFLWAEKYAQDFHSRKETEEFLSRFTAGFEEFGYDKNQNLEILDKISKDLALS